MRGAPDDKDEEVDVEVVDEADEEVDASVTKSSFDSFAFIDELLPLPLSSNAISLLTN